MIPYHQFKKLRLSQFMPEGEIAQLRDWEFMDHVWLGEAVGFSEWLRREDDPTALGSMALDLTALPIGVMEKVLTELDLPLTPGMKRKEIESVLGEPEATHVFTKDRKTYDFAPSAEYPYVISCTVHDFDGLIYLEVMHPSAVGRKGSIDGSDRRED